MRIIGEQEYRKLLTILSQASTSMVMKGCPGPLEVSDEADIHNSSTPHRIKMPSVEEEPQNGCKRPSKRKAAGAALCTVQQPIKFIKIPTTRGRKTLSRPAIHQNLTTTNHKLTEYFPVRRSVRKCKKAVLEEKKRDLEHKVICSVEDGLEVYTEKYYFFLNLFSSVNSFQQNFLSSFQSFFYCRFNILWEKDEEL